MKSINTVADLFNLHYSSPALAGPEHTQLELALLQSYLAVVEGSPESFSEFNSISDSAIREHSLAQGFSPALAFLESLMPHGADIMGVQTDTDAAYTVKVAATRYTALVCAMWEGM